MSILKGTTPGPWERDGQIVRCQRGIIANCPTPQNGGVFDVQDNAKLIAAAPRLARTNEELRAALREIDETLDGTLPITATVKEIARAALKRAKD
jgi:hypothetical protein